MKGKVLQYASQLQNELLGFKAFSICELKTGKCLYSNSVDEHFDVENISRRNVDFVKIKLNIIDEFAIDDDISYIIINFKNQIHVIDITPDKLFFFFIAVDRKLSNLAIVLLKMLQLKKLISAK